jgi:hypothetical protein
MTKDVDSLIAWFTGRQHGVVARWQLIEAGVAEYDIDNRVRRGVLLSMHRGVYRVRGAPVTRETKWHAATLAVGADGALSRRAAAAHHRLDGIRRFRPEVTGPYSRLPILDGADAHRTRRWSERDVIVKDGIRVTTIARTLLDCCAVLPYEKVENATQQAVIRKQVRRSDLWVVLDRVGGRGVDGTVMFRDIAAGDVTDATIQSRLELILKRTLDRARRIPPGIRQYEFVCSDGRRVRFDTFWPEAMVAVEADGLRWHGTATQLRETRARSRSIQNSGVVHLAYGWSDCAETPDALLREVESSVLDRLRQAA